MFTLALILMSPALHAQSEADSPLMMWEEPSHKVVFSRGHIRVMDVYFPGGATSEYHLHKHAATYVFVQPGRVADQAYGQPWLKLPEDAISRGQILVRSNYLSDNLLHRVRNIDVTPTQIFAVVNLSDIDDEPSTGDGEMVDGRIDNPWFRIRRLPVAGGSVSAPIELSEDAILMQPHDGPSHVRNGEHAADFKTTGGAFSFHAAGSRIRVVNEADTAGEFVLIEVKH